MKNKIFRIDYKDGEKQWVYAPTNIAALEEVLNIENTDLSKMKKITDVKLRDGDKLIGENLKPHIISATFYDEENHILIPIKN